MMGTIDKYLFIILVGKSKVLENIGKSMTDEVKRPQRLSVKSRESKMEAAHLADKTNGVKYLLKTLSEDGSNEGDTEWKPEIPFGNVSEASYRKRVIESKLSKASY
jgi:hypothetical protein